MSIDHPAVAAVRAAKRHLCSLMSPSGLPGPPTHQHKETGLAAAPRLAPSFTRDQVERMLRVEMTGAELDQMLRSHCGGPEIFAIAEHLQGQKPGPICIEGVDWYLVTTLPPPGWRVINPLDRDKAPASIMSGVGERWLGR